MTAVQADSPRIAIISKKGEEALCDLVFSKLATNRRFDLVERNAIREIISELNLIASTRSQSVNTGSLLGAQGLLVIHADEKYRHIMLIETSHGERIFSHIFPLDYGRQVIVDHVMQAMELHAPKLIHGEDGARRISVMPITREDGVAMAWRDLQALTALVRGNLAYVDDLIVVERDHLTELIFESQLSELETDSMLNSDIILRGSAIRIAGGSLRVNLRLTTSDGEVIQTSSFVARSSDLATCAKDIAAWVVTSLDTREVAPFDVSVEAAHNYRQAVLYRANNNPEALRYFELAYELSRTNSIYASAYLNELQSKWDEGLPIDMACDYFLRALDIQRIRDPRMEGAPLPFPSFLLSLAPDSRPSEPSGIYIRPLYVPRSLGGYNAATLRELIASKFATSPHWRILADPESDQLFAQFVHQRRRRESWSLASFYISGRAIWQEGGLFRLSLTVTTPTLREIDEVIEGHIDELEQRVEVLVVRIMEDITRDRTGALPQRHTFVQEARHEIERYYREYCRVNAGFPDAKRLNLWATICPAFFATPEQALSELRRISSLDGYDWDLAGNRFLDVRFWDRRHGQVVWAGFLEKLTEHDSIIVQYHALWLLLTSRLPNRNYQKDLTRFFEWYASPPIREAYEAGDMDLPSRMFSSRFSHLAPEMQDRLWNSVVLARVRSVRPGDTDRQWSGVNNAIAFIETRLTRALSEGDPVEVRRLLDYVADLRTIYDETMEQHNLEPHQLAFCERAIEPLFKRIDGVLDAFASDGKAPEGTAVSIDGATQMFQIWETLPDDYRKQRYISLATSEWIVEGSQAWIGIVARTRGKGPRDSDIVRVILSIDTHAGTRNTYTERVQRVWAPTIEPLLVKSPTRIVLAASQELLIVPIVDRGGFDGDSASHLGPERIGLPLDNQWLISALANMGNDFYMGLSRVQLVAGRNRPSYDRYTYGGLFRWRAGDLGFTQIAASNSLEPGPLNDCLPYRIETIIADDESQSVVIQLRHASNQVPIWWKLTPAETWLSLAEYSSQPDPEISWRLDESSYSLVYVADGRETIWQSFDQREFGEIGAMAVTSEGLLVVMNRAFQAGAEKLSALRIYYLPRTQWPSRHADDIQGVSR